MADRREGLPPKPFLYTIDQIAYLLSVKESIVRREYLHYEGRSVGVCPKDKMTAVDISPDDAKRPEWRVAERTLVRWMRYKGFKYYERGHIY